MLEKGTMLAGYRIDGILGRGGMGVVYEATQITLDRTVALKLLAADLSDDVAFRERFQREGQIQAAIDHPHIVPVYEAGETQHGLFLAMRLVRGPNLKDMIVSRDLDAGRTLRILAPIADALDAAHAASLIHRDMKPQNVLVGGRDHAYLADFGLTKGAGEKSLTKTGQFVGTLDYVSPEQIRGERATGRSDVYSLGAVLYECLTGVVPYPKESGAAVLFAHMSDPPPRPTDERPDLPPALDDVLRKAMAKRPEERHAFASELLRDAERAFGKKARAAFTPPGPIEVPEETGIRPAEVNVPTREAPAPAPAAGTQPADAPAAEARTLDAPAEPTRPSEAPTETAPAPATGEAPAGPTAPAVPPPLPGEAVAAEPGTVEAARRRTPPTAAGQATPRSTEPLPAPTPRIPREQQPARRASTPVRPERRVSPAALMGLAGLIVGIVVAGFLVGRSGSGEEGAAAGQNLASAGLLELSFPNSWERADDRPQIPGMKFADPIAIERMARAGGLALVAGRVAATGPALLPSGFLERLDDPPARDDAVKLGRLEAYRYRNLTPEAFDRRLTLYVAPTTGGVATVACIAGRAAEAMLLRECEGVAASLELTDGEAFSLGPIGGYARRLDDAIGALSAARRSHLGALRRAKTPGGQARSADRLAGAYRSAAGVLERGRVSPADREAHSAIVSGLKRTQSGYRRLAAAARGGNRRRYGAARRGVRKAETAVRGALAALERHGYDIE